MMLVVDGDVELVGDVAVGARVGSAVHFVEGVLEDAHLPHVLGRVGLVQEELRAPVVALTLHSEVTLVVHQVGDVVPLEKLRELAVASTHHDAWNPTKIEVVVV